MNCAICDDDAVQRKRIRQLIHNNIEISDNFITDYNNGIDLIEAYENGERYSIIFIDIQMKPINGITTSKKLRTFDSRVIIIIITRFTEYSLQGYDVRALNYLLKPVDKVKFDKVFSCALQEYTRISGLYSIHVKDEGHVKINIADIIYIESNGRKSIMHLDNQIYEFYSKISDEEDKLKQYDFIKVHRCYLVNMNFIQKIHSDRLILKNNEIIPISQNLHKPLFDSFSKFISR